MLGPATISNGMADTHEACCAAASSVSVHRLGSPQLHSQSFGMVNLVPSKVTTLGASQWLSVANGMEGHS